jgi:flagellar protein FliO/FliZ
VLASTPLAVGRNLHVVALGEKAWLVGSTDASVSLIAEVADKELIDAMVLRAAESPQAPRKDFGAMLGEMLGRKNAKGGPAPRTGDFLGRQRDRLRKF